MAPLVWTSSRNPCSIIIIIISRFEVGRRSRQPARHAQDQTGHTCTYTPLQTRNKKTKHIVNWSGFRLQVWSPPGHTSLGLMSHIIIFFLFTSLYIECSSRPTAALASTSNSPNLARITANLSFTDTFGARTSHVRPVGKPIRKKKKKVSRPPNHSVCIPELNPTSSITYLHNLMICQFSLLFL